MKIKKVECESFAGLKDKEVKFSDGLNLLIGENETGKSTLVDLIYQLLFQSTKLDRRQDKNFIDLYFPKTANQYVSDSIDGAMVFVTDSGEYKLEKEWDYTGGRTRLRNPDGTRLTDNKTVSTVLDSELQYGRGIYSELVFASQKRSADILKSLLDNESVLKKAGDSSSTRDEIVSAITKAVMESGGVEINKLEKAINANVDSYTGNWDFSNNLPSRRRGIDNPFVKGNGKIIESYYAKERVAKLVKDATDAEKDIELKSDQLRNHKNEKEKLTLKREDFLKYRDLLKTYESLDKSFKEKEGKLSVLQDDCDNWPKKEKNLEEASYLRQALHANEIIDKYTKVSEIRDRISELENNLKAIGEISEQDVREAQKLERLINQYNAQLSSLDLKAKIKKLGNADIEVYSLADGRKIDIDDTLKIAEAIKIVIPDVAEIELSPAALDTAKVLTELNACKEKLYSILNTHHVDTVEAFQASRAQYIKLSGELETKKDRERVILADIDYSVLEDEKNTIVEPVEDVNVITRRIKELCQYVSLDSYIGRITGELGNYEKLYGNPETLKSKIDETETELEEIAKEIKQFDQIPEDYKKIKDYDAYDENLKTKISLQDEKVIEFSNLLRDAENALGDRTAEEYSEELLEREEEFIRVKSDYQHWKHIQSVFNQVKNSGNQLTEKIAEKFQEYLSVITDDGIHLEKLDDKFNTNIVSGNSALTYNILSEGTKDTIYLAFRLAMLEYLFPEGKGLAVFDDPFSDMDEKRTKQACQLINKYAENNQVIFVTCDSKYRDMLDGKMIEIGKE